MEIIGKLLLLLQALFCTNWTTAVHRRDIPSMPSALTYSWMATVALPTKPLCLIIVMAG